jgi:hypothetical protein
MFTAFTLTSDHCKSLNELLYSKRALANTTINADSSLLGYSAVYCCWNKAVPTTRHDAMKAFRGDEVYLLLILDLGTRWGWVVSVTPWPRFIPGERTPGTHCTGGWVGPRAGLDTEVRGKILSTLPGIEPRSPGRPVRSQTLYWLSYPGSSTLVEVDRRFRG